MDLSAPRKLPPKAPVPTSRQPSPSAPASASAGGKKSPGQSTSPDPGKKSPAKASTPVGKLPPAAPVSKAAVAEPAKKSPSPSAKSSPEPAAASGKKSPSPKAPAAVEPVAKASAKAPPSSTLAKKSPSRIPAAQGPPASDTLPAAGKVSPKKMPPPGGAPPDAAKGKSSPARQPASKLPSKLPENAALPPAAQPVPAASGAGDTGKTTAVLIEPKSEQGGTTPAPSVKDTSPSEQEAKVNPTAGSTSAPAVEPAPRQKTPPPQVPQAHLGPDTSHSVVPAAAQQPSNSVFGMNPDAAKLARTATVNVCVAADDELIPDWRAQRMMTEMPMNLPVRGFVERLLLMKMKWATFEGVVPVAAQVKNGTPSPISEEVLELNLTPHELGWEPNTFCWVWLQKAGKYDSPQRSTKEIYKERLRNFYTYYQPEKVFEADSILTDFDGAEELLFAKLAGTYGPEPTSGQLKRKVVQNDARGVVPAYATRPSEIAGVIRDMQIQYLKDTGQYNESRAVVASSVPDKYKELIMSSKAADSASARAERGSLGNVSLGVREYLTSALMNQSDTLLRFTYYRKLLMYRTRRQELRRVVDFMRGGVSTSLRKDFYTKWKTYWSTKKMRRQVQQSTEMAAKSESLVGDLATENTFLKSEMQRLRSQVEMLDNSNSKRLESLYNSSELAIGQIRILSAENQQKEELINKLEQRLLSIGNMMLQANDDRDRTLEISASQKVELDRDNSALRTKVQMLEDALKDAAEQIESMRPLPKPASCTHCPHYFELQCDVEVLHNNAAMLRARIEDSESDRRKLQENVKSLMSQVNTLRDGGQAGGSPSAGRRRSFDERSSDSDGQDRATPPPPPPPDTDSEDGRGVTPPPPHPFQQPLSGYSRGSGGHDQSMTNPSFGFAPRVQQAPMPPSALKQSFVSFQGVGKGPDSVQQPQPQVTAANSSFAGYDPHASVQSVPLSMHSFFEREAATAREKTQLAMNRQLQPRLRSAGFATTHGTIAPDVAQKILDQKSQYLVALNSSSASLPSTHQRVKDAATLVEERTSGFGTRPMATPSHSKYDIGQAAADPAEMRRNIFAFKRL